jgi:NAD-dependent DNA ligase
MSLEKKINNNSKEKNKDDMKEELSELMSKLVNIMNKNGEPFKARAYKKAEETIISFDGPITDVNQLKGKDGIGSTIMEKLKEFSETGTLRLLEKQKNNPINVLTEVYGIGFKKAKDLVDKGITTIEQLREKQDEVLNDVQKIGLKYFEDILERIPRSEIDDYNKIFEKNFKKVADEKSQYEIVGSYRRGAKNSGDIDVIITSKDDEVFKKFIDLLIKENIIVEVLSRGKSKCLVITKLGFDNISRRVDFLYTNREEYPFSVLYFTGSKAFNTVMRGHALKMGYTLNEHRIRKLNGSPMEEKKIETEKDIFDLLQLEYKAPNERIDGRSIIPIGDFKEKYSIVKEKKTKKVREPKEKKDKEPKPVKEKKEKTRKLKIKEDMPIIIHNNKNEIEELIKTISSPKMNKGNEITLSKSVQMSEENEVKKPKKTRKIRQPKEPKEKKIKEPKPVKEKKEKTRKLKIKEDQPIVIHDIQNEIEEPIKTISSPKVNKQNEITLSRSVEMSKENEIVKPKKTRKIREHKVPKEKKVKEPKEKKVKQPKPVKEKKEKEPKKEPEKEIKDNLINIDNMSKEKSKSPKDTLGQIEQFKKIGFSYLETLNEKQLSEIIKVTNDYYYNTKTALLTDNEYDIVKEYTERKFPKNTVIKEIGAPVGKNKVKLPYEMASMDKIKPHTNEVYKWMKTYSGPYVISCKLDGVSGLYSTEGDQPKLYTRGDGKIGQDISHLLSVFDLPKEKDIVVRGEFIIPKEVFNTKYKSEFSNPRNLVSGIINSKSIDQKAKDLHFVSYEVIKPSLKPSEQMDKLKELKHETVKNKTIPKISNDILSDILVDWRKNYHYEIDGIIVSDDNIYPRKSGNPEHAFAFKMVLSEQMAEAKVIDVIWTPSKNGYLKPRVRIEPVNLSGVNIEYATGFNGKFIEDNKIGIGAIIQIIRSGDVIPHIKSVTTPAETPKMPLIPYKWTDTKVDIVLENVSEDITVREKNITAFFVGLEVDGLSSGNVKRLMNSGFDTVPKILQMSKSDYAKVEGFKEKMIEKIYNGIKEKINSASLLDIMVASNLLGRGLGERKIKPILEAYPNILTSEENEEKKIDMLKSIKGIGKENADSFVKNIPSFMEFLKECNLEGKLKTNSLRISDIIENNGEKQNKDKIEVDTNNPLFGKKIVMSKIRDKEIIEFLKTKGAELDDNIRKDTFVLIIKSKEDISNKTKYARENNIPIMLPSEFKDEYM